MHDVGTRDHDHPLVEPGQREERAPTSVVTADGGLVPAGTRIEPGDIWRGNPTPRKLWIDATQGASGDMLLGALLDAGADGASIAAVLDRMAPGKLHLQTRRVVRGGFAATKVDVIADEQDPPARHLSDVEALINTPGIPATTQQLALRAFRALAVAEAAVHGTDVDDVHFHEVGALDSIGDIVGVCEAIRTLGVREATSSVVAVGSGTVRTQHGLLAVPPPAVAELARGWQIEAGGPPEAGELCTPTGLTLIRALCDKVETLPQLAVDTIGVGAGSRIRSDRPGLLRVLIGTLDDAPHPAEDDDAPPTEVVEVSANVDDLDPRLWPAVIDRLLDAGSVDAWLTPIVMKKGRPAHTISALVPPQFVADVTEALITHTSTIGVRTSAPWRRRVLQRTWRTLDVDGHRVRIKISGDGPGSTIQQATAEFADVEALADAVHVPQRVALARAMAVAWREGLYPGAPWPMEADG